MTFKDYSGAWAVDTEYVQRAGEHPCPVCYCAVEVRTGERRRVWLADGAPSTPPISFGPGDLFVTYSARSELGVHLALGWPLPVNVLDLHLEHLRMTNGRRWETCKLTSLRRQLGLTAPADEHKELMRQRILAGPPFSDRERENILEYCLNDALMLVQPLQAMFGQEDVALAVDARGEFMKVAASMEHFGLPIDLEIYESLRRHLPVVWRNFVTKLDRFGLYEDGHFRHSRLDQMASDLNLAWPRTEKGNLKTDEETWEELAALYPNEIRPYANLRHIQSWLREGLDLRVGSDGRSRPLTFPFWQKTGRTSPSGSFIFAHPKWLRGLLKPLPGTVLFYADFAQQEPALAGFLSGDIGLRRCYNTACGSFYVALMIESGVAPKDATKQTHPHVHKAGKVLLLAISYGAGTDFVATKLSIGRAEAEDLLRRLKRAFPVFFKWREEVLLKARWQRFIETPDGWRQAVDSQTNPRAIFNYPMQGCGAAMTRCAAILAAKAGLRVLGTVHDALVCESDSRDLNVQSSLAEAMDGGADLLAPSFGIRHEIEAVPFPRRYVPEDAPARIFWNDVMRVLSREDGRDPQAWLIGE